MAYNYASTTDLDPLGYSSYIGGKLNPIFYNKKMKRYELHINNLITEIFWDEYITYLFMKKFNFDVEMIHDLYGKDHDPR